MPLAIVTMSGFAVVLVAEGGAGSAEAADDFIHYEQGTVLLADLLYSGKVVLGRDEYAATGNDRLHDDPGDRLQ
jgi:hypothetical protein